MKANFKYIAILIGLITGLYFLFRKKGAGNRLDWPLEGKITVTQEQGYRTVSGKQVYHSGIDLKADVGTPIINPAIGKVIYIGYKADGGNEIIVQHDGFRLGYSHLRYAASNIDAVKVGKTVRKGQGLGVTGNTGNTTGPHLHLTYTDALGFKKNPRDYFKLLS